MYGAPKIIVRTDHRPLQYLFTAELVNPSIQRWAIYLSEFNIEIQHIPGRENVCGDFLSRINWSAKNKVPEERKICHSCNSVLNVNLEQSSECERKSSHY